MLVKNPNQNFGITAVIGGLCYLHQLALIYGDWMEVAGQIF
jgi:hypothetical protein